MIKPNIFVIAGRTGGPLLPAMAIANKLEEYNPIIIGVKNSFEEKYSKQNNLELLYLPEAKLTLASFSKLSFLEIVKEIVLLFVMVFLLFYSFFRSIYYIFKYRPMAIITAGSFLAVPLGYACYFTNFFRSSKTKIIIHQQDAKISLSNKIVAPLAHKLTCYFKTSIEQFRGQKPTLVTNPIDFGRYNKENIEKTIVDPLLKNFVEEKTKPLLLIFGGGSGAVAINKWVFETIEELNKTFKILHLTGVLQQSGIYSLNNSQDYQAVDFLGLEMPYVLYHSDLVICRAGMSSITELLYLQKPAFLIPIPNSHQELNAKQVQTYFPTLRQQFTMTKSGKESWLNNITKIYPEYFGRISYPEKSEIENSFLVYIEEIKKIIKAV